MSTQPLLPGMPVTTKTFDGITYTPTHDQKRLTGQLARVYGLMLDGHWRTLHDISIIVCSSEAGVSARLRDLRKEKFGAFTVNKRRRGNPKDGLWEYQLERDENENN